MSTLMRITERGKKQRKQISLQEKSESFCSSSEKMRNACGLQGEKELAAKKKQKGTHNGNSFIKHLTGKFHLVVMLNNGKEMFKKVYCTCQVCFLLIKQQ